MNGSPGSHDSDPQGLARAFDAFIAARWRGDDESADAGTTWFAAHWTMQAPPEPDDPPDAASVLGAAGHGIRWYARGGVVLGYAGQAAGCYQVAPDEAVPAPRDPWFAPGERKPGEDHVLDHAAVKTGLAGKR